jgi:hypothetical protein
MKSINDTYDEEKIIKLQKEKQLIKIIKEEFKKQDKTFLIELLKLIIKVKENKDFEVEEKGIYEYILGMTMYKIYIKEKKNKNNETEEKIIELIKKSSKIGNSKGSYQIGVFYQNGIILKIIF